jgi:hypothetical protein
MVSSPFQGLVRSACRRAYFTPICLRSFYVSPQGNCAALIVVVPIVLEIFLSGGPPQGPANPSFSVEPVCHRHGGGDRDGGADADGSGQHHDDHAGATDVAGHAFVVVFVVAMVFGVVVVVAAVVVLLSSLSRESC